MTSGRTKEHYGVSFSVYSIPGNANPGMFAIWFNARSSLINVNAHLVEVNMAFGFEIC